MGVFGRRVAIVTGSAQGLGLAVATRMHAEGARVMMCDLQADKVAAAAVRLDPAGANVKSFALDASASGAATAMVAAAESAFGGVDILVNVAGGSGVQRAVHIDEMTDDIWDRIIANNLRSTFVCSRAAVPAMRKRGGGTIVNFATGSIRGFRGRTTSAAPLAYVAAKAGIIGFTNQLAADCQDDKIGVAVIQPGFILTEPGARIRELFDQMSKAEQDAMLRGRTPRPPEDIGWAVSYIASRPWNEVTATAIRLDGPIKSLALQMARDPEGQLASTAVLSAV